MTKVIDVYEGPATLILSDGTRLSTTAMFKTEVDQIDVTSEVGWARTHKREYVDGLKAWRGAATTGMSGQAILKAIGHVVTVELPDGTEGEACLVDALVVSCGSALTLEGIGRAPYEAKEAV